MQPLNPDTSYHIFNHANGFENIFRHEANYYYFMQKYRKYIGPIAETYAWCLMPNHFHLVIRIRKREVIVEAISKSNNNTFSKVRVVDKSSELKNNPNSSIIHQNFGKGFVDKSSKLENNPNFQVSHQNFGKGFVDKSSKLENNPNSPVSIQNFGKGFVDNRSELENNPNSPISQQNFGKGIHISDKQIELFLSKQFANLFSCYTQSFNKVYNRMGSLFIKNFKRVPITDKTHFLYSVAYTHRNPIHHGFCTNFEDWLYSSYNEIIQGITTETEAVKLLKMNGGLEKFISLHNQSLNNMDSEKYPDIP